MFRKSIFWLHLVCGIVAGLVIGIMSFTGAALAFEKEIVAYAERDARRVELPETGATPLPLDQLVARARETRPEARPAMIVVSRDPEAAVSLSAGRGGGASPTLYVDPYTGAVHEAEAPRTRAFMRTMMAWHRWVGAEGENRNFGKAITGACNVAFLGLAITGLYLWWPRSWTRATVRAVSLLNLRLRGKARDFNWHNAVGLWTAPVLIVLTATAMPISYRWAGDALYHLTGTEPPPRPAAGGPPSAPGGTPPIAVTPPAPDAVPLGYQALLDSVQRSYPQWEQITFRLASAPGRGNPNAAGDRAERPAAGQARRSPAEATERRRAAGPSPVSVTVKESGAWPRTATTTLTLDPFTGSELKREGHADQNAGRRLRTWTRFLHTGEALGWPGQLIAGIASLGGVVLTYTGFALAWRRFRPRRSDAQRAGGEPAAARR